MRSDAPDTQNHTHKYKHKHTQTQKHPQTHIQKGAHTNKRKHINPRNKKCANIQTYTQTLRPKRHNHKHSRQLNTRTHI